MHDRHSVNSPLAITCGDPAGVGPEIIAKLVASGYYRNLALIGPESWLQTVPDKESVSKVSVGETGFQANPGEPSEAAARIALEAMECAAQGCADGLFSGVVTGPVSKWWLQQVGYTFPGQTEFFADRWQGEPTMAFAGGQLRVVLATWHIPFHQVPAALDEGTLTLAVERAHWLGKALGADEPRIGVCGLNPHAGEGGVLGNEERDTIDPILDKLRERFPAVSRTLPGDTVFNRQLKGDFNVCVAMYHDQGLAPVKTLEFERSVNITLGLPHVRTSPDHGTAFDIAGKGVADTQSFAAAIDMALKLAAYRTKS